MKENNNNYIIYKAENVITNEVYIGATTKSIDERKLDHLQKSEKKVGSYFQEAIQTYGMDSFSWEQIDTASSNDELAKKEVKYIQQYNALRDGYNEDRGGGIKKTVYQFNSKTGELINSYESLSQAAEAVDAVKQNISDVCLGFYNTCKGYAWSYDEDYKLFTDKRKKEVIQFDLNKNFIAKYESLAEASRVTNASKTCIARCCRGDRTSTHGFIFEYN
ncbi:NUMOD1 domain-containing DNA-binding protein [Flavobacterium sp.]|jgi:hypothetical protein|uniref:NUMOD1 domain-containing DNA-binding protein n=1 Tax=Flavobacterium sp. TaxID=239 RepID=UPI0037C0B5F1